MCLLELLIAGILNTYYFGIGKGCSRLAPASVSIFQRTKKSEREAVLFDWGQTVLRCLLLTISGEDTRSRDFMLGSRQRLNEVEDDCRSR